MVIGLTGGSGAGKTTVAAMMKKQGMTIIDADLIARDIVKKGEKTLDELVEMFGPTILDDNGNLNRHALAGIVFSDPKKLQQLNAITHPRITAVVKETIAIETGIVVIDAPLLYEAGLDSLCAAVIIVVASFEIRLSRIMARDGISAASAEKRLESQKLQSKFLNVADFILENDGDKETLEKKLAGILNQIMGRK